MNHHHHHNYDEETREFMWFTPSSAMSTSIAKQILHYAKEKWLTMEVLYLEQGQLTKFASYIDHFPK